MTAEEQLDAWVEGNPIHREPEGICTPDFSCCHSAGLKLMPARSVREAFRAAHLAGDT
jgi:hypothetical protein